MVTPDFVTDFVTDYVATSPGVSCREAATQCGSESHDGSGGMRLEAVGGDLSGRSSGGGGGGGSGGGLCDRLCDAVPRCELP